MSIESVLSAPALLIRNFEKNDLEAVTSLMRELNYPTTLNVMRERMENMSCNPLYCNMVAELDGTVVGMIMLRQVKSFVMTEPVTQITSVIVTSSCRRQGIGKRLIQAAETWARQQGSDLLFLTSGNREELAPAHAFYEHIGFEKAGYQFNKKL
ncbi:MULTISPECIES: GNAT family N-acetyltransferase [Paenibacillus]|jgi:predicted N-acetyltransferase YhbS|uniref:GCN5-related N-acetyltransferase n=3 Tax=Paenibacillus TaxID=44249 RepID=G4HFH1_9BACL|nr:MULTISPECIES: GNAT family N-acetyltransferase [Paenibacillus]ANY71756.1 histone acetyltransferase [Paenibacillus ihbetae]EHB64488.1 GCN5-related N-acetyltransferase [Paenibacillus lactis 154]MBP1892815.1 putative N-acetyltransferase YhbS [Paenibacillus lactis]MCM3495127.1 GNAT family N-acetyltransferase [Paenibacillus lactis]OOC60939.1 N-acetyltransferase [Paenibacillus ihbetae]